MGHMRRACDEIGLAPNAAEKGQVDLLGSLSPMVHLFLTSLFVGSGRATVANVTFNEMTAMFRAYAEEKHVLDQTTQLLRNYIEMLTNYSLMVMMKSPQKRGAENVSPRHIKVIQCAHSLTRYTHIPSYQVLYSLKISATTLLKVPTLAAMHKGDLMRCAASTD
jgi:hypothetical protein